MKCLRSCQGVGRTANRIKRSGFGVAARVMIIGLMVSGVTEIGMTGSAFARGGYGPSKPPTPFTPKEILLIEKCRAVAHTDGMDSALFLRECSAIRSYIYY